MAGDGCGRVTKREWCVYLSVYTVWVLVGVVVGFWLGMSILLSFLLCLSLIWMYFSLFLPNPLSLVLCLSLLVFLYQCVSVCLSFYVFSFLSSFPSSFSSSVSVPVFLSVAVTDSRCLHLRWNSTGAAPGKVLPLSSTSSALSPALHHRIKLASLSFFLCSSGRSCSSSPYRSLSYSSPPFNHMKPQNVIQTPQWFRW